MKKFISYLLAAVVGSILTVGILTLVNNRNESRRVPGLTVAKVPGNVLPMKELNIYRVITENTCLVYGNTDALFLYLQDNHDDTILYDGLTVKIPSDKHLRIVGTYQQPYQTIPAVALFDK